MTQLSTATSATASQATKVVQQVRTEGVAVVPGVFSQAECMRYVNACERLVSDAVARGEYFGSRAYQVIYNYFLYDPSLYGLFAHPLIDEVMLSLIDKDYVLIAPSARNPRIRFDLPEGEKTSGLGWHTDARIADVATGDLYRPSQAFYAVVALEPFEKGNSATLYVPKSHLLYKRPPNRDAELECEVLEAGPGSVVFFDAALWHRAGEPTNISRWSIFNQYGPWFMKPFFRFAEHYTLEELKALPPTVQKLLHLCCTPPKDANARRPTVTKTPPYDL
jgi:ectoine hydroxylase-related dioxygenase (phytanoyl-CoA dioxygenase family)